MLKAIGRVTLVLAAVSVYPVLVAQTQPAVLTAYHSSAQLNHVIVSAGSSPLPPARSQKGSQLVAYRCK